MRMIFMGTPEFALPTLDALNENYDVIAVFTPPDRKAGRGRRVQESPVKTRAKELGIPIYQPETLKIKGELGSIARLNPDLIIVAAYGKILPIELLRIPKISCINVHASLLPRWRGAAPIQAAIYAGDPLTGVSIMKMDAGLDTGPVYAQETVEILADETGGELSSRLARLGARVLMQYLPGIISDDVQAQDQDETKATYAPMLRKSDGRLDFDRPAIELARQVRAYEPWPGSFFHWRGNRIAVREAEPMDGEQYKPGTCLVINHMPAIAAKPGILSLRTVQPAGKRPMPGNTFLNGAKDFPHGRISYDTDAKS